jgi:TPR repeat protein
MKIETFFPAKRLAGWLFMLSSACVGMFVCQPSRAQKLTDSATAVPCNLAIVSKVNGAGGRACDEKTVRELARHGQVYEQNELGMASILVIGHEYSTEGALQWFERAARRGYAPAQVNLAVMYSNGWGTATNYGKALYWLQLAAEQKYARAYFDLGAMYLQGKGVRQDYPKAFELFRKGAEGGDPSAESNLGYMYDRGLGVAQNEAAAAAWYGKAADRGDAMGENNQADMYLQGEGVAQDDSKAFQLFEQAAVQGHTGARIKLGYMYADGRGTKKDLATALMWVSAATSAGDRRGQDLLDALKLRLTAGQIAEAEERARGLRSSGELPLSAKMLLP